MLHIFPSFTLYNNLSKKTKGLVGWLCRKRRLLQKPGNLSLSSVIMQIQVEGSRESIPQSCPLTWHRIWDTSCMPAHTMHGHYLCLDSITVTKCHDQKEPGEQEGSFGLHCISKGGQDRNSRQELGSRNWGRDQSGAQLTDLPPWVTQSNFYIYILTQDHLPRITSPHNLLGPPYQPLVKKIPYRLAHRPI